MNLNQANKKFITFYQVWAVVKFQLMTHLEFFVIKTPDKLILNDSLMNDISISLSFLFFFSFCPETEIKHGAKNIVFIKTT